MNPYKEDKNLDILQDKVWYARAVFGKEEIDAVTKCLSEFQLSPGKYTYEFEKAIAKLFDKEYGIMVNSGSSALLLAAEILDIKPGDEVITGASGFATTITPFIQKGATVILVDVDPYTLSPKLDELEKAITPKTKAILATHIWGAILDMPKIREIADRHGVKILEDSCDSLGAKINGYSTGKWSDISVVSFYPSHVITAGGGGGMICVNSQGKENRIRNFRDWGRSGSDSESLEERFSAEIDGIPYDSKFVYHELGYNLKSTELQAAFGLAQLKKLNTWNLIRKSHYDILSDLVSSYGLIPAKHMSSEVSNKSWLAFPFFVKDAEERRSLAKHFEERGIQTRPILAGNFIRHEVFKISQVRVFDKTEGADEVAKRGLGIGLHPSMTVEHFERVKKALEEFYG